MSLALTKPGVQSFKAAQSKRFATARMSVVAGASVKKPTVFDAPVSNHGARVRFVLYKKGLTSEFDIVSPQVIGGMKSEEYLALNPQGKIPLLVLPDGTSLPESEVIVNYILDAYKDKGPSLTASTPLMRAKAELATRIHDLYIANVQGCMYRQMDAAQRAKDISALNFQLNVLEKLIEGPFVAGNEITTADGALFPTFVFMTYILPQHFGWKDVFAGRPKLHNWWVAVNKDPEAAKVMEEVRGGLQQWSDNDRWTKLGIKEQLADKSYKWDPSA